MKTTPWFWYALFSCLMTFRWLSMVMWFRSLHTAMTRFGLTPCPMSVQVVGWLKSVQFCLMQPSLPGSRKFGVLAGPSYPMFSWVSGIRSVVSYNVPVRPITWTFAPWTCERLKKAFRHKKPRAAKGPDGVSQLDLISLPEPAVTALMGFYQAVERGSKVAYPDGLRFCQ